MSKTQNFTEGKIFSPLIRFAFPVLLALFLQAMYGAVDLMIVGQFGGTLADVFVSAVSTGSQIMMTLTVVITGLSMGLTVYVGEKIGAGRQEEAGEIIGSGILLFGGLSLGLTLILVPAASGLTALMQAPDEAFWIPSGMWRSAPQEQFSSLHIIWWAAFSGALAIPKSPC